MSLRRTTPIEVVSPDLPGMVLRARRLTLLESGRLGDFYRDPGTSPETVSLMAAFLAGVQFVAEYEGRAYTASDFLIEADAETVQMVLVALLQAQRFTLSPPAPEAPKATVAPE